MADRLLEDFGIRTFDKTRMKKKLPYPVYQKWKDATRKEDVLDKNTADIIAHAMKEWAIENGATHYCHWFQPLNGLTAKKHDAFLDRSDDKEPIIRFSGKELIKGEPDASSFPSGGMRSTFEARGYTYWDCTANTFIIDNIMYIPSMFISFTGETLDKKTPLLKSLDFISDMGSRLVNLYSDRHVYRLRVKVGLEQEFFLIDKKVYERRPDLINTGRTLIGKKPSKAQELSDHYFGAIPERVAKFYQAVNKDLWELGIFAKTEHNEVAPCQFEIAILFENVNIAVDDNLMLMEILKKNAKKFDLVCLLHEKPFEHVNGSGKHNNWSLSTNYGDNCLEPGEDPQNNILFLLFTSAVLAAVDKYAILLRYVASCPGNDYRLGGDEAPPSIVSIYLGDYIEDILLDLIGEASKQTKTNGTFVINNLGYTPHDSTDRNRTSPFAFTGNKFEFRMLGSSKSAADVNVALNTCVGNEIKEILQELESISSDENLIEKSYEVCRERIKRHKRILFAGDGYSKDWLKEAEERGLPNIQSYYESIKVLLDEDTIRLFVENNIYTETELRALYSISLDEIINTYSIEIGTFIELVSKKVIQSIYKEIIILSKVHHATQNNAVGKIIKRLDDYSTILLTGIEELQKEFRANEMEIDIEKKANKIYQLSRYMTKLRKTVDKAEEYIAYEYIDIPSYEEIFMSID